MEQGRGGGVGRSSGKGKMMSLQECISSTAPLIDLEKAAESEASSKRKEQRGSVMPNLKCTDAQVRHAFDGEDAPSSAPASPSTSSVRWRRGVAGASRSNRSVEEQPEHHEERRPPPRGRLLVFLHPWQCSYY